MKFTRPGVTPSPPNSTYRDAVSPVTGFDVVWFNVYVPAYVPVTLFPEASAADVPADSCNRWYAYGPDALTCS